MFSCSLFRCRFTALDASRTTAVWSLLPRLLVLAVLLSAFSGPVFSEDCVGATVQDVTGGGAAGTSIEILYRDAMAGGIGGDILFTMPHSAMVDGIMVTGTDGFATGVVAATGTETTVQISTQGTGSPSKNSATVTYNVVYSIGGMAGAACSVSVAWAEPSCTVRVAPDPPAEGLAWMVDVFTRNLLHDTANNRFGELSSTAPGLAVPVALQNPNVSGANEVNFFSAHQVASYSSANDAGIYTAAIAGPGGQSAQCSWPLAAPVIWQEVGDAGDHVSPQTTGAAASAGATLVAIEGTLDASDWVDVFCIKITEPALFRATTNPLDDASASAAFDTQLFLIAPGGAGLAANDDSPTGGNGSLITAVAAFAGSVVDMPQVPSGEVLLAINAFPNEPLDGNGNSLFQLTAARDLVGPETAGNRVDLWTETAASPGAYTITLQGAAICVSAPLFSDGFEFGATVAWQ